MSMFLPDGFSPSGEAGAGSTDFGGTSDPQAGADDIALMQRVLAAAAQNPSAIPESFMSYVLDWLQINNLQIPISQVFGYGKSVNTILANTLAKYGASVSTGTSSASHTFAGGNLEVDVTGPSVTVTDAGSYILFVSMLSQATFADGSHNEFALSTGDTIYAPQVSVLSIGGEFVDTLTAGQTVTSTLKMAVGGSGSAFTVTLSNAKIIALRYA